MLYNNCLMTPDDSKELSLPLVTVPPGFFDPPNGVVFAPGTSVVVTMPAPCYSRHL